MSRLSSIASQGRGGLESTRRSRRQVAARLYSAVATIEPLERRTLLSVVFAPASSISLGAQGTPFAVVTADVNHDGIPDIITANENGTIDIMLGNGDGTFRAPQNFNDGLGAGDTNTFGQNIIVTDINGDTDIIVANGQSSTVSILQENTSGSFTQVLSSVTSGASSHVIALTETTANGTAFLITGDNDGSVSVTPFLAGTSGFTGFGTATFEASAVVYNSGRATASFITSVAAADFNGDGTIDLVVVGTNNLYNQGHAELVPFNYTAYDSTYHTGGYTRIDFAAAASLDNTAGTNAFSVMPVRFSPTNSYSMYSDLLVAETNGDVIPLTGGEGSSVFAADPAVTTTFGAVPAFITVGDFNGDGNQDFLLSYQSGDRSQEFLGNGNGGFTAGAIFTRGSSTPSDAIRAAQLTGDGLSDIVATYYQSPTATIGVSINQTPAKPYFTNINAAATFTEGVAYSYNITVHGFPEAKLTLASDNLPPGLHFTDNGNDTGVLSGTPTGAGGNFTLDFKAANSAGTTTEAFVVTVDHAPTIISPDATTFAVNGTGKTFSFTFKTTGGFPTPTINMLMGTSVASLTSTTSPAASLTFTNNNNGSATLSGGPAPGDGGIYDAATDKLIEIQAISGGFTATQIFTLTVDQQPLFGASLLATAASANVTIGSALTPIPIDATEGGTTFPIAKLSVSHGKFPSGVTFQNFHDGQGQIAGTPAAGTAGTYTVIITASNSIGKAEETVTIVVADNTQPKFTNAGSTVFDVGKLDAFFFSTTLPKHDTAATLSEQGALPTGVTFKPGTHGNATLTGKPAAGTGGVYVITVFADAGSNDSDAEGEQSFTLTVREPPTITSPSSGTLTAGLTGTLNFTTDGSNYPPPTLSISGLPADLDLVFTDNTGDGTASLTGTPPPGTEGTYLLTVKATNLLGSTTQKFTLTVAT